jgi:ribulose 1,5-bisphosphate synthetase/thiazole synthase
MEERLQHDVIVCGTGVAGIASALAKVRDAAKTCLQEKDDTPGGCGASG